MKNSIIGITLDEESAKTYSKFPWYAVRKNYSDSVERAGGVPIFLPNNINSISRYLDIVDGIIITGGNFDVDPKYYGEKIKTNTVSLKPSRTNYEFKITEEALKKKIPILGICGGQQLLNVVFGGSLFQHLPEKVKSKFKHEQPNPRNQASHYVKILKETFLKKIVKKNKMFVNSAHHQAVKDLGKGLQINAIADDGVIEGIEYQDLDFCIGIQWHPEFLIDSKDIEIFRSLVNFSKKK